MALGALIGAGASILGSLLGGGDKEVTSRVDYKRMVKDAEAAGFNPLTAIRNGGSAGYTVTTHPGLSSGEMIGNALGQVGGFLQNYDPHAQRMRLLEADLAEAKIANLQADTYARQTASIGGVPTWTAGTYARTMGQPTTKIPDTPTPLEAAEPLKVTNPHKNLKVDPTVADAAGFEERYSDDVGGLMGGLYVAHEDAVYNWPILGLRMPHERAFYKALGQANRYLEPYARGEKEWPLGFGTADKMPIPAPTRIPSPPRW